MTSAGVEPDPSDSLGPAPAAPVVTPRRATNGRTGSKTVPGPARPRRAKPDASGRSGSALLQLAAEVGGDASVVWQFVGDYLDLLDHRVAAVEAAITAGNAERAEVALLSLESTSLMVGADAIVRVARPMRVAVGQSDFAMAQSRLSGLRRAKAQDRARLEQARQDHDSDD